MRFQGWLEYEVSLCAQREQEMGYNEHLVISELAHSFEHRMPFHSSTEHLFQPHGVTQSPAHCSGTPGDAHPTHEVPG